MPKNSNPAELRSADDFLKEIGGPTKWDTGPGSATPESAPHEHSGGITGAIESVHDFAAGLDPSKGITRSLAGAVTGIPRAANQALGLVAPKTSEKLGNLAERIPGVKRLEAHAAEPNETWAETFGSGFADTALALAGGGRAAGAVPVFTGTPGKLFATAQKAPGFLERTAKGVAGGAAMGAATDPADPGAGAVLGGVTGGAAPAIGKGLQTKAGQWLAGQVARRGPYAAIASVAAMMHVPVNWLWETGVAEAILFRHAPWGAPLDRFGRRAATTLGRLAEQAHPGIPGTAAGSLGNMLEDQGLPFTSSPDEGPSSAPDTESSPPTSGG